MTQIGPLRNEQGKLTSDPQETCQLLIQQYNRALSIENPMTAVRDSMALFTEDGPHHPHLTDIHIKAEDIKRAIKELRPNAAAGQEGVQYFCF